MAHKATQSQRGWCVNFIFKSFLTSRDLLGTDWRWSRQSRNALSPRRTVNLNSRAQTLIRMGSEESRNTWKLTATSTVYSGLNLKWAWLSSSLWPSRPGGGTPWHFRGPGNFRLQHRECHAWHPSPPTGGMGIIPLHQDYWTRYLFWWHSFALSWIPWSVRFSRSWIPWSICSPRSRIPRLVRFSR